MYQRTLLDGEETDNAIRVNAVGTFAQGKTSLTNLLIGKTNDCIQSTNGVEINSCKYSNSNDDVVFDTSSPSPSDATNHLDRIATIAQRKNKRSNQTDIDTFPQGITPSSNSTPTLVQSSPNAEEFAEEHKASLRSRNEEQKNVYKEPPLPTQAKASLSKAEVRHFSDYYESKRPERSLDGNLEIWDFAGQFVFYATHTLFHSKRAIYLLVFDLSKPLSAVIKDTEYPLNTNDKTMEQFIKFWMNSIHAYVGSGESVKPSEPRVILVGTHKDMLDGNEEEKEKIAEDYFESIRAIFDGTPLIHYIHSEDFALSCVDTEDKEIVKLRKEIISIGLSHAKHNVPAKWIPLERELIRNKNKKVVKFRQVMQIDSQLDFPLKEEEQVKLFLLYHHTKGTFCFYDEKPLSEYVVLDAMFLIDAFKCIITSGLSNRKQYRKLWNSLKEETRIEDELINIAWGPNSSFIKHKQELLMFMQKHLIISWVSSYDEDTGTSNGLGWYVVPSLLCDHSDNKAVNSYFKGRKQSSLRFLMSFYNSPVVQIIYYRLIAALTTKWPVDSVSMTLPKKKF